MPTYEGLLHAGPQYGGIGRTMGPLPSGFIAEVIPSACVWLAVAVEEEPRLLSPVLRPPMVVASLPCLMCPPMCAAIVDLHLARLLIPGAAVDVIEP